MKDRIPTPGQEGRMLITPENGDPPFYATVAMADNPSEDGTPLHKATLLKDATVALFGLGSDAVPDDVYAWLGKYNQHWWERTVLTPLYGYNGVRTLRTSKLFLFFHYDNDLQYANSINIDQETGEITLVNPTTITILDGSTDEAMMRAAISEVKGKYVTGVVNASYSDQELSGVFYVPADATGYMKKDVDDGTYVQLYFKESTTYEVTSQLFNYEPGEKDIVRSTDRNAYPDSGESDGYEWQYLGVPFENAVTAPKIETGSYVGTGGAGLANANSFTFEAPPILMAFVSERGALLKFTPSGSVLAGICFPYLLTTEYQQYGLFQYSVWEENYGGSKSFYAKKSADGKTISWYSTSYYPTNQFNDAGITYNLVAICMGG